MSKSRSNLAKNLLEKRKEINSKINTLISESNKINSDHIRRYVLDGKDSIENLERQQDSRLKKIRSVRDSKYEKLLDESKKKSRLAKKLALSLKNDIKESNTSADVNVNVNEVSDKVKKKSSLIKNFLSKNKKVITISSAAIATAAGAGLYYKNRKDQKKKDLAKNNIIK